MFLRLPPLPPGWPEQTIPQPAYSEGTRTPEIARWRVDRSGEEKGGLRGCWGGGLWGSTPWVRPQGATGSHAWRWERGGEIETQREREKQRDPERLERQYKRDGKRRTERKRNVDYQDIRVRSGEEGGGGEDMTRKESEKLKAIENQLHKHKTAKKREKIQ